MPPPPRLNSRSFRRDLGNKDLSFTVVEPDWDTALDLNTVSRPEDVADRLTIAEGLVGH